MQFQSATANNGISFDWVDQVELTCPYIENIARNPKVTLINEEDVVLIEKAKKITVESVKDLSKHTQFIDKVDEVTKDVQPSKILMLRREETFNTYENRFIYTLIINLDKFIAKKEEELKDIETKKDKVLEYAASTKTINENINIAFKMESKEIPKDKDNKNFKKEIDSVKVRIKKIREYITSWRRCNIMVSLDKLHVPLVFSPIKKTNLIIKNPNFQMAMKLWVFLQSYNMDDENDPKNDSDTKGTDFLKLILDDSFLFNYYIFDSISTSKREQKEKLSKYAVLMIKHQIQKTIKMLINNGIDITDEQIISMISNEIQNEKNNRQIDSKDVKKKFKSAIDEYLERTQDYL